MATIVFGTLYLFLTCLLIGQISSQDATVSYRIREERPVDTYIGSVSLESQLFNNVSDEKLEQLQFQIISEGKKYFNFFRIDKNKSVLYTTKVIDREDFSECFESCSIDFMVTVFDLDIGELTKFIKVIIEIEDYNDNAPEFLPGQQALVIPESMSVDSVIISGIAVDLDQGANNSVNTYIMLPETDIFELEVVRSEETEFVISLKNKLDRESVDIYQLVILAKDGGIPQLTGTLSLSITVADNNDNFPVFAEKSYNTSVQENIQINSTILTLHASDEDDGENGKVSYQFGYRVSNKITDKFEINSETGELTAIGLIDFETDKSFDFQVQAVDHGTPSRTSTTEIHIKVKDVNDNSPKINLNLPPGGTSLSETSEINAFVTHVGITDLDSGRNGVVTCNVLDDHFKLEEFESESNFKIVLNRILDHDVKVSHNVTIICQDSGNLPRQSSVYFIVHVEDVNDNFPIFSETTYNTVIEENNAKGASIVDVSATDKDSGINAKVIYSLHAEASGLFIIDSFTGVITANRSLDRELDGDLLIFRVLANDATESPKTTTATVVVKILDQNDNDPIFFQDPIKFYVPENQAVGTSVGNISVSDPDNGLNGTSYLIFPNDPDILEYFQFSPESGFIKTNKKLDRERISFHKFHVNAADLGGRTSSTLVTVFVTDKNDNDPEILFPKDDTIALPYPHVLDKEVIQINARDADYGENAQLYYYIDQDNASYAFNLNLRSGKLYLNTSLRRSDIGQVFSFVIRVKDGGNPALNETLTSWTTLNIRIVEGDGMFEPSILNTSSINLWIVIVIIAITVVLSFIMIIVIIKICWVNRQKGKGKSSSSDIIMESNEVNPKLIESSSSSSSRDSNSNEKVKFQDGCVLIQDGYLGNQDETGSILSTTLSSVDRHMEEQIYIQKVKELSYSFQKKIDETNSDNSGEMGTRDSGQGGSDVDINSLSELPVLDIPEMSSITDSNPVPSPRSSYLGSFNPVSNHSNTTYYSNETYPKSDIRSQTTDTRIPNADSSLVPRNVANFSQTAFKTAERKEISKLRKSQKRVMFSDDLENSHSSGRSSTMSALSFSDINSTVQNAESPRRLARLHSDDTSMRGSDNFRSNDILRRSVDNLDKHKSDYGKYNQLPSNRGLYDGVNSFGKRQTDIKTNRFNVGGRLQVHRNLKPIDDWANTRNSSALVYTLPQYSSKSSSSRDTESTTTSGSYNLTLDGYASSPTGTVDEVFA